MEILSCSNFTSSFTYPLIRGFWLLALWEVAEDVVTGTMTVMQRTCDGCAFLGFFVILSCQFAKHLL